MPIRQPTAAIVAALSVLGGCAHRETPAPVAFAAPAPTPPRPELSAGYGAVVPPARLADGRYATINSDVDADHGVWHVRAALNVAAIACRAPEDAGITPAYNALLDRDKTVLAEADAGIRAGFRRDAGDWRAAHDRYMTRLYNFFAMPAAKPAFCAVARVVAAEAADTAPAGFATFAASALPRLEAPFVSVYAAVDAWRVEVAGWDARYGAQAMRVAAAGPPPPRLDYANVGAMLAWQPADGTRYARR